MIGGINRFCDFFVSHTHTLHVLPRGGWGGWGDDTIFLSKTSFIRISRRTLFGIFPI